MADFDDLNRNVAIGNLGTAGQLQQGVQLQKNQRQILREQRYTNQLLKKVTDEQDRVALLPKCPECQSPVEINSKVCGSCKASIITMLFEGIGPFICLKENAETAMNAVIQEVEKLLEEAQKDVVNAANGLKKLVVFFYPISIKNSDEATKFRKYLYWKYTPKQVQKGDYQEPKQSFFGSEKAAVKRSLEAVLRKSTKASVDNSADIDKKLFLFKTLILNFLRHFQRVEDNLNAARQCRDYAKENRLHLHNFKVPRYPFMQTSGEDIYPHKIFRQLNDNPQLVEQDLITIVTTLHPLCMPADSISQQGYETETKKVSSASNSKSIFSVVTDAITGKYDAEEPIEAKPSQTKHEPTLWVMKPNGEVGGPFTRQYLSELKAAGKLPKGLKASESQSGPWHNLPTG